MGAVGADQTIAGLGSTVTQARICPVLRLALEQASRPDGITSIDLARKRQLSIATASSRLGKYVARGYLEVRSGKTRPSEYVVYEITNCGKRRLEALDEPAHRPFDFTPLLSCWGWLVR